MDQCSAVADEAEMNQRAGLCLPLKKRVQDSYRQEYTDNKYSEQDPKETKSQKTYNFPQPHNVEIIRTNVRFLNEPVTHMETESTRAEQFKWWLNNPSDDVPIKMAYSKDSTQRRDFQPIKLSPVSRVQERPPATGIIPALSPQSDPKELFEYVSFNHQYGPRHLHDQLCLRKCQGAFVWNESGARGAEEFQRTEGLRSPSEERAHGLNSSQQMCVPTESCSTQSSSDDIHSQHGNGETERIPSQSDIRPQGSNNLLRPCPSVLNLFSEKNTVTPLAK